MTDTNNEVVKVVKIDITKKDLQDFLDVLNKWELTDEGDEKLTIENVVSRPNLLDYIVDEIVNEWGWAEPLDFWNGDGWCDIRDYL